MIDWVVKFCGIMDVLGNCYVFGIDIIVWLGEEYVKIGKLICYILVDSVF